MFLELINFFPICLTGFIAFKIGLSLTLRPLYNLILSTTVFEDYEIINGSDYSNSRIIQKLKICKSQKL